GKVGVGDADADARVGDDVLDPLGLAQVLRDHVVEARALGEPDLDLARLPGAAAGRRQGEELRPAGVHPSPQLRPCPGRLRNRTRLPGIARPFQSPSSRGWYLSRKRVAIARRSGESARNSTRPRTATPPIDLSGRVISATTETRGSRCRLVTFGSPSTL